MSDWPLVQLLTLPTIHTYSHESVGIQFVSVDEKMTEELSTAYPLANRAIYIPFSMSARRTLRKLFCWNGAAVSGNVDMGIYDHSGVRLQSNGPVAQAGINSIQVFNITDTRLTEGMFYMAIWLDNIIGTLFVNAPANVLLVVAAGMHQETVAGGLPSVATFARPTSTYVPQMGIASEPPL